MKLYCATTNPGKLREFGAEPIPGLKSIPPCEETGVTFEENAIQKAVYYSGFTSEFLFADDSGLEVDALHGAPGVYSARFAGPGATDAENNCLLIQKLASVQNRTGRYVCVIAKGSSWMNPAARRAWLRPLFLLPSVPVHLRRSQPGAEAQREPSRHGAPPHARVYSGFPVNRRLSTGSGTAPAFNARSWKSFRRLFAPCVSSNRLLNRFQSRHPT